MTRSWRLVLLVMFLTLCLFIFDYTWRVVHAPIAYLILPAGLFVAAGVLLISRLGEKSS